MHELGFDLVRLPVSWAALEPTQGHFDDGYLAEIDAVVHCAGAAQVFVLIDMHQDAYSKEIGEDGAPLWAIAPPPSMLLGGPMSEADLRNRRMSSQVQAAFVSLFATDDAAGLQAALAAAWTQLAAHFADDPNVVGFEVFNEPDPVADQDHIDAFNAKIAAAIRAAAPGKLVFFEPSAIRNIFDFVPLSTKPFAVAGAVYAPHVYTFVFSDPMNHLATATIDDLRPSIDNANAEAQAWHAPLFIGEFGLGPDNPSFERWMDAEYDLQDEYGASSTFWLWKEESQGFTGLFDHDATTGAWTERTAAMTVVSRPRAARIAGTPTMMKWDRAAGTFTLAYDHAVDAPNVVYVPDRFTATVSCDGTPVTDLPANGWLTIPCGTSGAHTIVVALH
jgi:endoglycosylceramidase